MNLSAEAAARVARALGAYIRDTPARQVPRELKRFRSLRPQAVAARAPEVIAALDDKPLRDLVVEWLDDKPTLSKKEAEILRLVSARPEGWEQEVERLTPKTAPKKDGVEELDALRERVAREREKAAQAREDARKAKDESRLALQEEKRRTAELDRDLAALARELEEAKARVRDAEARSAKDAEAGHRAVRRHRRDADRARRERDEAKEQLRAIRKEVTALRRTIRDLERRVAAPTRATTRKESGHSDAKPKKRRALRPPPGLFEEAPESLVSWLQAPSVHVLIDGYNVTKAEDGFGDLHLPAQRERLIEEVARLGLKYDVVPAIVFDGSDVPPGSRRRTRLPVKVEYSSSDEIADDHLIARLRDLPPDPVIVVTNDRELQDRARAEGATVATSNQLLALVR